MDKTSREIVYKLYHNNKHFSELFLGAKKRGQSWFIYKVEDKATRLDVNAVSDILREFEEVNGE